MFEFSSWKNNGMLRWYFSTSHSEPNRLYYKKTCQLLSSRCLPWTSLPFPTFSIGRGRHYKFNGFKIEFSRTPEWFFSRDYYSYYLVPSNTKLTKITSSYWVSFEVGQLYFLSNCCGSLNLTSHIWSHSQLRLHKGKIYFSAVLWGCSAVHRHYFTFGAQRAATPTGWVMMVTKSILAVGPAQQ